VPSASHGVRRLAGQLCNNYADCADKIELVRRASVKIRNSYLNSVFKFHVTKLLEDQFLPPVACIQELIRGAPYSNTVSFGDASYKQDNVSVGATHYQDKKLLQQTRNNKFFLHVSKVEICANFSSNLLTQNAVFCQSLSKFLFLCRIS
jgi:hypothetical protein